MRPQEIGMGTAKNYVRFRQIIKKGLLLDNILKNEKLLLFITTLQEAFSAIIPYFLMASFLKLAFFMFKYFNINLINLDSLNTLVLTFGMFSSIIAVISISYFFALRLRISPIIAPTLSIAAFVTISLVFENPSNALVLPDGFNIQTIFVPIASTYLLKYLYPFLNLKIPLNYGYKHVYRLFNYVFVFAVAYFTVLLIYLPLDFAGDLIIEGLNSIHIGLPNIIKIIMRIFYVQLFWFFGIHGSHITNALFTKSLIYQNIFPHLTIAEFFRLFVTLGGAGVGLSMFFALIFYMKDNTIRLITKISAPFVIFNINTLLIYAVVVLNRFLLIPFILLPILNSIIAYTFLNIVHTSFSSQYIAWNTPIFLNSYIKTNGNTSIMLLQLSLLFFDTIVYAYFINKFSKSRDLMSEYQILEKNLDITTQVKVKENIQPFKARCEIFEACAELEKTLDSLTKNSLFMYYQPKIDIKNNKCTGFEALIRYDNNGKLTGPVFLDIIEKAGLAPVIDVWVCKEVKRHIDSWKDKGFYPLIGVNLHPDTLASKDAVEEVMEILKGENIMFEIIERSFVRKIAKENLLKLQKNGFKVSIDDYGTGYSNIESIINLKIEEIKIDKSVIDEIETQKGLIVCRHITNLCHDLCIDVVAEGVETKGQLDTVKALDIDIVQGFYFSDAIPSNNVVEFSKKFGIV